MSFQELIGNDKIKKILKDSIIKENILHSYLFYGKDGIGKKKFAIEYSKMILCEEKQEKTCEKCKSCIEFNSNNNPDFYIIEPDGNSIKIDQIRQIQKDILEKPINGNKKIYIINNADSMTKEAQNCLLKTLEEPQSFLVIMLIASNENNILPTVKSRCTKVFFEKLTNEEINTILKNNFEGISVNKNLLDLCDGSASKIKDVIDKTEILNTVEKFINNIEEFSELDMINYNTFLYDNKENISLILEYMNVLLLKNLKNNSMHKKSYISTIEIIELTKNKLKNSNNYDMTIDNMLIRMWGNFNEKNNRCKI